ncbi:MAG: extracellular solute-binding protein [Clostridiales bacterium]|jgi:multiple sugar transport system substrate-binding protein|nr:extracellular solute-binding protein [Clostridiales bacterium]
MKKFAALMLVFVLILSACTGRGDNTTTETTPEPPVVAATEDDSPAVVELNEYGLPVALGGGRIHEARDFGGRTLVIGAWWDRPLSDIAWGDPPDRATSSNYSLAMMRWENARRVEQAFNVRFDYVNVGYDDFLPQLTTSVLTGSPFADVVVLDDWMQFPAMNSLIQPWNNVSLPASDLLGNRIYTSVLTRDENDNIWVIDQNGVNAQSYGLGVNLDIINVDGLPNPVDLFEAGEWTWDAMLDIMRRATRDTDNDGVNDQFGIAGQPGDIVQHLIGANDGVMVDSDRNYGFSHQNTVEALEFVQQIFSERLWAAEAGGVMDTGNWDRNFYIAYQEGHSALFPGILWAFQNSPPAFNFAFVPFPTGPSNESGNTWLTGFRQGYALAAGSDWSAEDVLIIMEELWSWPGDEPQLLFESGDVEYLREHYRTEGDVQRVIYAGNTAAADIGRVAGTYYWVLGGFASAFWNQEMDVMQAIEFHRGPQQEMLDEFFRSN